MPEMYYVVRNDRPARALGVTEPVVICGEADAPGRHAVYDRTEKHWAFEERDRIRDECDNPDVNVYRMQLESVDDPRSDGGSGE